ncbi:prephenate dehydrogenase/arogenate dehydrogenase family protein [Paenalcaligenes niemegkensis]|uniref:prephenate dehydrogenase n=1 Tax=Paenalcaligenes niemegkensis TaxID=2895469 RepID=UPI001EE9392B|nr:prephenate dehydrogenase/arogenate dehydrogenase family protein [Paenalcaligenes niemegkensis]MCQ9616799.1 prephenate dehydrogenase/arogenate dehydrogenase family protein [Paenalcaligenes niemegkensis]
MLQNDAKRTASQVISTLAIVGPGLIGGSVAAALRQRGAVGRVLGVGRNPASLDVALAKGLIDEVVTAEQAAQRADVVLLATPVGATQAVLQKMLPFLQPHTILTDAGSTKADVVEVARKVLGAAVSRFIPGHPIAGSESTGPAAAHAALYEGRTVVLTPLDENESLAKDVVVEMWKACGARVLVMTPEVHDTVLASVSHVPHFLSSVFMWQVSTAVDSDLRLAVAGSGFRDFTRIAAGSPEVWRDIFLSNREAVLHELREVRAAFEQAESALQQADGPALENFLERAALARRLWASRSGLV